jgi:hypothetical protein
MNSATSLPNSDSFSSFSTTTPHDPLNTSTVSSVPSQSHSILLPRWVPDALIDLCMLCSTPFSLLTRKHHCRQCGCVCCAQCSKYSAVLPFTKSTAPVRVCEKCHAKLLSHRRNISAAQLNSAKIGNTLEKSQQQANLYGKSGSTPVSPAQINRSRAGSLGNSPNPNQSKNKVGAAPVATEFLSAPIEPGHKFIPNWAYLFSLWPFSGPTSAPSTFLGNAGPNSVPIGRLSVKVMGATNLPAENIYGTLDSYVQIDLCSALDSQRPISSQGNSQIVHNSIHPEWNFAKLLNISAGERVLRLNIYDFDELTAPTLIGAVNLPLNTLKSGVAHTFSKEIQLTPAYYSAYKDKIKQNELIVRSAEKSKPQNSNNSNNAAPTVNFTVEYTFSAAAQQISEFFSLQPAESAQNFNSTKFLSSFRQFIQLIEPISVIFSAISSNFSLLLSPIATILLFTGLFFLCYYPALFLTLLLGVFFLLWGLRAAVQGRNSAEISAKASTLSNNLSKLGSSGSNKGGKASISPGKPSWANKSISGVDSSGADGEVDEAIVANILSSLLTSLAANNNNDPNSNLSAVQLQNCVNNLNYAILMISSLFQVNGRVKLAVLAVFVSVLCYEHRSAVFASLRY